MTRTLINRKNTSASTEILQKKKKKKKKKKKRGPNSYIDTGILEQKNMKKAYV